MIKDYSLSWAIGLSLAGVAGMGYYFSLGAPTFRPQAFAERGTPNSLQTGVVASLGLGAVAGNKTTGRISAESAITEAISSGYTSTVLSVKASSRDGRAVWKVTGLKNLQAINIYVDTVTGKVVARE